MRECRTFWSTSGRQPHSRPAWPSAATTSSIGRTGALAVDLTPGAKVYVRFEGGVLVPAVVKWAEDGLVGLAFINPVLLDRSSQSN